MVSHAVAGILHVQIVLSHWSMHSYAGRAYTGADDEWYITTMRTTMNVATPPPLDWVHIGLQFQVEHHLYPRLPRHNLRAAREMVREVVHKHFPPGSAESGGTPNPTLRSPCADRILEHENAPRNVSAAALRATRARNVLASSRPGISPRAPPWRPPAPVKCSGLKDDER